MACNWKDSCQTLVRLPITDEYAVPIEAFHECGIELDKRQAIAIVRAEHFVLFLQTLQYFLSSVIFQATLAQQSDMTYTHS